MFVGYKSCDLILIYNLILKIVYFKIWRLKFVAIKFILIVDLGIDMNWGFWYKIVEILQTIRLIFINENISRFEFKIYSTIFW